MATHTITQGDTRTPLGMKLVQRSSIGVLGPVNLTGELVKFKMIDSFGVEKIALSDISVIDAVAGEISYLWVAADVNTPGTYFGWAVIVTGAKDDHFPVDGRTFSIAIIKKEP